MKVDIDLLKSIVFKAGQMLLIFYKQGVEINLKGERDLVTTADIAIENFIKDELYKSYPAVQFMGEETSGIKNLDTCFILDPVDGTTNFAHNYPAFCISLAYMKDNEILCGVVFEPLRSQMFSAKKDSGAFLNEKKINVSNEANLKNALLATGFPYTNGDVMSRNLNYFNHIIPFCRGIRRAGSAALDLCYTACGVFDGFFELNLKPWDVSAGILITREAGGIVTDINGKSSTPFDDNIVATNSRIHATLLNLIKNADNSYEEFKEYYKKRVLNEH